MDAIHRPAALLNRKKATSTSFLDSHFLSAKEKTSMHTTFSLLFWDRTVKVGWAMAFSVTEIFARDEENLLQ